LIDYYLLTKPGIVFGNLITLAAAFSLGSSVFDLSLFFVAFFGLALVMASSCILNNDINSESDQKMERTKNRALAAKRIPRKNALILAAILGISGMLILTFKTNLITALIAAFGFIIYVGVYSFWKCRTIYGTAIGALAGAVPPVVGYTAASGKLDTGALLLFTILIFWQMPHFFAIAIRHLDDYKKAGIHALPIQKGLFRTKVHTTLYIIAFIVAACFLTLFGYTGNLYLIWTVSLGTLWLLLSLKGFTTKDNTLWAKQMFQLSLIVILSMCCIIPFS